MVEKKVFLSVSDDRVEFEGFEDIDGLISAFDIGGFLLIRPMVAEDNTGEDFCVAGNVCRDKRFVELIRKHIREQENSSIVNIFYQAKF